MNWRTTSPIGSSEKAALLARGIFARWAARSRSPEPQLRQQPQHRHGREAGQHQPACGGLAPQQPQPVEAEERPGLGAQERGAEPEQEGVAGAPGEVAIERGQPEGDKQALRVAQRGVAQRPRRHRVGGGRGGAGGHAAQAPGDAEGHHDPRDGPSSGDEEPQVRRGAAEQRERRGQQHRERLPRRAIDGRQIEVQDLATPDDPRPRVVRRRRGNEEGERSDGQHRQRHAIAHGDARHGKSRHAGTGCCELLRSGHGAATIVADLMLPAVKTVQALDAQLRARAMRCSTMIRRLAVLAWLLALALPAVAIADPPWSPAQNLSRSHLFVDPVAVTASGDGTTLAWWSWQNGVGRARTAAGAWPRARPAPAALGPSAPRPPTPSPSRRMRRRGPWR